MSRIGKKPVEIPNGVDIKIHNTEITVKGPRGQLHWLCPDVMSLDLKDNRMYVTRPDDSKQKKALHGLTRSVIANMVTGVVHGFTKALALHGIGYRAQVQPGKIVFSLGYSHAVEFALPEGIKAEVDKKQTRLEISGIDKQLVGQVAANIVALRLPDAYKGKGIRYEDKRIKLKPGKTGK